MKPLLNHDSSCTDSVRVMIIKRDNGAVLEFHPYMVQMKVIMFI
jgi:hypothetical protein